MQELKNRRTLAKKVMLVTMAWGLAGWALADQKANAQPPLELFGVKLKGATRDELREAFKAGGLQPTRVDNRYWADTYNPASVMEGASEFAAGYVFRTGTFAYATYKFEGFMDTQLVTKVARMVINKYGPPSTKSGSEGLGEVNYRWNLAQGMVIRVERGWPDTTTYLRFVDLAADAEVKAEQDLDRQAADRAKAKAQTRAF